MRNLIKIWIVTFYFFLLWGSEDHPKENMYKLLIYYGIPDSVNQVRGDLDQAAKIFANYDYIVLGDGLQEPDYSHHNSTKEINSKIHQLHNKALIFGYVDLGVSTNNYSESKLLDQFQKWKETGVDGIFLDDAGYDFNVPRSRLNSALQTIHDMDMSAFVNAWNPDDVMEEKKESHFNPEGEPTLMGLNDYYLLEDFLLSYDPTDLSSQSLFSKRFKEKIDKVIHYRNILGVKMLSISIFDYSQFSDQAIEDFFHLNEAAAGVFSLDGYGISPKEFSSSKIGRDLVIDYPYMENYMKYYTTNTTYLWDESGRKFWRGMFYIYSNKGENVYKIP